jgi:uncharacterized protein YegP (UPF0339 family)
MKFVIKRSNSVTQPYYWIIKSSNGQTLAQSETYVSKASAQSAIATVKANASTATVEDDS